MRKEDVMKELEELSNIVENRKEEEIGRELEEIEKLTKGEEVEEEERKEEVREKEEVKKEEKTKEEEVKEKKEEEKPHRAIKIGTGFKYASASLIAMGAIVYVLAFYLRWSGWRLIAYPPSAIVALIGTLLILAGGEIYYRGRRR